MSGGKTIGAWSASVQTETIDRLYLELSQFTNARTSREIELERERDEARSLARELTEELEEADRVFRKFCPDEDSSYGMLHAEIRAAIAKAKEALK
jgi:hypothetical protein